MALFERIDTLEDVAQRVDEGDRVKLQRVVREELAASPPVRPVAAARVLDLSEKTIRTWVAEGVLQRADTQSPRLLLDTNVLHAVANIVKELRAAGQTRALLDEVHRRLVDATWLERDDLADSLSQMCRGDLTVRIPKSD
ncbi:MAG TPA: hypothetical protein PLZ93_07655 [Nocardioides sp.]|nr:hypothetical protein [Nocardioides sp.]HRI95473.1 hypothetical protein [Nocardioides sp.]